jgi:formylglycine-generating enzyme required for sulfatase activity
MARVRHVAAALAAMFFAGSVAGLGVMLLCVQPAGGVSFFDVDAKPREGPPATSPPVTPPPVPPTPTPPQPPAPPVTPPLVPPPAPESVVAPPKSAKMAPPDAATQEKNLKLARMIFEKEYAQDTPDGKRQLVAKLLDEAGNIRKNLSAKFVLLEQARDLAIETGDAVSCRRAIEQLDEGFVVDARTMAAGMVAKFLPKGGADPVVLGWALDVADALMKMDDMDGAARLAALFPAVVKDADLAARLKALQADIGEYLRMKPVLAKLQSSPDDPAANLEAGRYYCCVRGDWAKGLPLLAKGSDAALKAAAAADLANPTEAAAQFALANQWWEAAKGTAAAADSLRDRAGTWYEKALPGLTDELEKVLAQKRLAELAAAPPPPKPVPSRPSHPAVPQPKSGPASLTLDLGKGVTMKLVLIRPGTFIMGSPDSEQGHRANESPQHEVIITKPFYMGVTEVTQAQYEAVMGTNPSKSKGPTIPVESVTWDEAVLFCRKLSEKTGNAFRLPTEAEWEYACRAGSKTRFSFGDSEGVLGDYAWYKINSGSKTRPVGQKKPNAWGLYDMHGNVWEWCEDWYGEYPKGTFSDPLGPATGSARVNRGGSRGDGVAGALRSAYRSSGDPARRRDYIGFRCARTL